MAQQRSGVSYRSRKRWSLVLLLVGLPAYIIAAVSLMSWLDRPSIWIELGVYVGLGILWALPFKAVFRGIGQPDPDAPADQGPEN
jgi:Protein of unknown function (DUF2842)